MKRRLSQPRTYALFLLIAEMAMLTLCLCSVVPLAGGGTEGGNVSGVIARSDGSPASHVAVHLLSAEYDPVRDGPLPNPQTTITDSSGRYSFDVGENGRYNILSSEPVSRQALLITGIDLHGSQVTVPAEALKPTGFLRVTIPDSVVRDYGYLYCPGTTIALMLSEIEDREVLFSDVPAELLKPTGFMRVTIPDSVDRAYGYLYCPGTTIALILSEIGDREVLFSDVPASTVPSLRYRSQARR